MDVLCMICTCTSLTIFCSQNVCQLALELNDRRPITGCDGFASTFSSLSGNPTIRWEEVMDRGSGEWETTTTHVSVTTPPSVSSWMVEYAIESIVPMADTRLICIFTARTVFYHVTCD